MADVMISVRSAARTLGIGVLVGATSGFLVGGIGGRLFMFVLSQHNPEEDGALTDDGEVMGQFTASGTLDLLTVGTVIGIFGGFVFLALRGLRFGPRWFQVLSMPVGATMVVGSMLVNSDGADFALLQPWWLAVGMTLAVPFVYTLLLAALADRWIGDRPSLWSKLPAFVPWGARLGLTALAAVALVDLVSTIDAIARPFQFG